MLDEHAKVLTVLQYAGEIIGRKKLQKIVFILKKLGYPFREKYGFHFFGPYSEELTLQTEELDNLGFLKETKEKQGGYHQYRYELTPSGETFLQNFKFSFSGLDELVTHLNQQPSRFLELVSTALYFEQLDESEKREKIKTVKAKQNYTEDEIDQAFAFIRDLKKRLVSKTTYS
ncbi:YwgA family protein [Pullulanibacillus sp. KACC 23026]|uniref:YwgA family protein n=1 Tax=Pullulanibacillus sp. KACC 23026 TaxID=3028315 RepID=UPI0023B0DCFA|nr:YwgA family protein [Pullulanibacillus sp. KACC 23026]WEG13061.1 YwgA family protein [Pullulanibacillus sp. KACC 23026]